VAVVGVGSLGQHHARLLAALPEASLAAVVDRDAARAAEIAERHGVPALGDHRELGPDVEAVTIAVPTVQHARVAGDCLRRGLAVLVEKPLTASVPRPRRGSRWRRTPAGSGGRHTGALQSRGARSPAGYATPVHRSSPPRGVQRPQHRRRRGPDLADSTTSAWSSADHRADRRSTVRVQALTDKADIANARLRFANGSVANLTASRISVDKVRKLRIFEPDAYWSIDYARQEGQRFSLRHDGGSGREIVRESLVVEPEEPLLSELRAFVRRARGEEADVVSGAQGLEALRAATRILEQIAAGNLRPGRLA
jgi:predicted dehydrogenase